MAVWISGWKVRRIGLGWKISTVDDGVYAGTKQTTEAHSKSRCDTHEQLLWTNHTPDIRMCQHKLQSARDVLERNNARLRQSCVFISALSRKVSFHTPSHAETSKLLNGSIDHGKSR